jgi:hypothetical protein
VSFFIYQKNESKLAFSQHFFRLAYCGIEFKTMEKSKTFKKNQSFNSISNNSGEKKKDKKGSKVIKALSMDCSEHKARRPNILIKSQSCGHLQSNLIDNTVSSDSTKTDGLDPEKDRKLNNLHKLIGDSVFLIELLRFHPLANNSYMSPLLCDDNVLKKFPKTYLIVSALYILYIFRLLA